MAGDPAPLEDLAEAILDGHSVDWASAESSAETPEHATVRQLRVLAGIVALHRSLATETPAESADAPQSWGRLEILERLGKGSFGEVYRAWDSKLDREVAVKLLHADGSPIDGETALREARLLARVRHPNVVTVYDADEIDGRVGLWMEFIHGRTLEQILGERSKFDDSAVTRIGIELCRALAAVHDAGLLHRDIKAQNLMQNEDGRVVLMDFGTGRELLNSSASSIDSAGTPLYLAPEIFSGSAASIQSDIYSAGVLLFHLWTGGYPVRGANIQEVRAAHARGQRVDVLAAATRSDRVLAAAVARAIEPNPTRRFQSAKEMLSALEGAERATETRRRKRVWLLGSVAFLAAIAFGIESIAGRREPPDKGQPGSKPSAYFGSTAAKRSVQRPPSMVPGTPSPDGKLFPYATADTADIALYEFATGISRKLTQHGDGGDLNFASGSSIVSADGTRVAYEWSDEACHCTQLRVIDADGQNERILYAEKGTPGIDPQEWSDDGTLILGVRKGSEGVIDIVLVSVSDGTVNRIHSVKDLGRVALSPDGRYVAFDRPEAASNSGIFVTTIAGGDETPVVTGPTDDSQPMWTPDGSGLVFASLRTGGPSLWIQRIVDGKADGKPRLLDKDMGPFRPYTLTRTGSLFYDHRTGLMDVYVAPIDPATGDVVGEPRNAANRFLGSNLSSDWSPDGDSVVFASWRTLFGPGSNILVLHSFRTGEERELELDLAVANGVHWSPDGRSIAVGGPDHKGVSALRLVDALSGKVVAERNVVYGSLAWDVDGRHVYVRKNTWQIARLDVNTGDEDIVFNPPEKSVPGDIALSPDGRWLAHTIVLQTKKAAQLILIPTGGGLPRTLVDLPAEPVALRLGGWTRDGRHVLFVRTTRDSEGQHVGQLWIVPFQGGSPRPLGLSMRALREVRVSPDGSRISFTAGYPDREMWVFEDFLPQTASPLTNPAPATENPPNDSAKQTER